MPNIRPESGPQGNNDETSLVVSTDPLAHWVATHKSYLVSVRRVSERCVLGNRLEVTYNGGNRSGNQ